MHRGKIKICMNTFYKAIDAFSFLLISIFNFSFADICKSYFSITAISACHNNKHITNVCL